MKDFKTYALKFRTEDSKKQVFNELHMLARKYAVNMPEESREKELIQWLDALEACEMGEPIVHMFIKDIVDTLAFNSYFIKES